MKTFNEFIEQKNINTLVESIAGLMAEMDINPAEYILENAPEMELDEGFMDSLKAFGKNAFNAAKQFGKNVWDGGGIKGGAAQAHDTLAGPASKFDSAARVLTDLVNQLQKNAQTASMPSATNPRQTVASYLGGILKGLMKEKENIPKMQDAQVSMPMAPRGGAPAPAPAPATP
jgi:hypothetical protein